MNFLYSGEEKLSTLSGQKYGMYQFRIYLVHIYITCSWYMYMYMYMYVISCAVLHVHVHHTYMYMKYLMNQLILGGKKTYDLCCVVLLCLSELLSLSCVFQLGRR